MTKRSKVPLALCTYAALVSDDLVPTWHENQDMPFLIYGDWLSNKSMVDFLCEGLGI